MLTWYIEITVSEKEIKSNPPRKSETYFIVFVYLVHSQHAYNFKQFLWKEL